LENLDLDHLIIVEFTLDFARTSSDEFVEHFLVGKLHAHTIVVGFNHYFGHNREGNFTSLYNARERLGFQVEEIPEQEIQNETVSSTRIRKALNEGNIQRANAYLEHHYMIRVKLEALSGQNSRKGHPGFRMLVNDPLKLLPPPGAYAASFLCSGQYEKALVYLEEESALLFPLENGVSPGFEEEVIRIHLRLDVSGDSDFAQIFDALRELIY